MTLNTVMCRDSYLAKKCHFEYCYGFRVVLNVKVLSGIFFSYDGNCLLNWHDLVTHTDFDIMFDSIKIDIYIPIESI